MLLLQASSSFLRVTANWYLTRNVVEGDIRKRRGLILAQKSKGEVLCENKSHPIPLDLRPYTDEW